MTDLVLLRHGETVGQSSIRLYGSTDIPLSPIGEAQLGRAAAALSPHRFVRVLTSPLQRARRSAEIVLAAQREPAALEVVTDFREIDFGAWEGWTYAEAEARDPDGYRRWHSEGTAFTYPAGESRSAFHARVHAAAHALLAAPGPGPILGVLHKGVIKAVLAALTGQTPEAVASLPISLGSLHRLRWTGSVWELVATNETAHLGDLDIGG
jgi:broad specificity phosphatase PhoE